ncbi:hypothetical protein Prum_047270 [Phytohabitans rumicis]|uniref:Uncharacterized protein n=1 Tax=Phytohabitans rumicis TaxID=1076125 RepID=A0A6V8LEJ6_9ACTN|nr:hypothetical protein Prum_047270 [Phytohabitans rumicis]
MTDHKRLVVPPSEPTDELERPARRNGHVPGPAVEDRPGDVWDKRVASGLAFLRRRMSGQYEVDEFGFDAELTDQVFYPVLRLLYRDWFRTEVFGRSTSRRTAPGWWSATTRAPSRWTR